VLQVQRACLDLRGTRTVPEGLSNQVHHTKQSQGPRGTQ
jgi:hypothetical protein